VLLALAALKLHELMPQKMGNGRMGAWQGQVATSKATAAPPTDRTQRRHHHPRHRRGVFQLNSTRQTTEADIKYTPRCAAGGIGHAARQDLALTIYSLVTRLNFTWRAEGNTAHLFSFKAETAIMPQFAGTVNIVYKNKNTIQFIKHFIYTSNGV